MPSEPRTIKVRIPVAVDPQGRYYAYIIGGDESAGPDNLKDLLDCTDMSVIGPGEVLYWLTAELPVPTATEVSATVEEGPSPSETEWEDLRGRAPDATGHLTSEAFVRRLRDGWPDRQEPSHAKD